MAEKDIAATPMMRQFYDLKAKHPDAVLLFRCGDFYETYCSDAIVASEILGITLTKRSNGKNNPLYIGQKWHSARYFFVICDKSELYVPDYFEFVF